MPDDLPLPLGCDGEPPDPVTHACARWLIELVGGCERAAEITHVRLTGIKRYYGDPEYVMPWSVAKLLALAAQRDGLIPPKPGSCE